MIALRIRIISTAFLFMGASVAASAEDPLSMAITLYGKRHYEQAARVLEEALPRLDAGRAAQAQLVLGTIYLSSADLFEALARTGAAVELEYLEQLTKTGAEGRSRYARLFLAETLLANGNADAAARHFKPLSAKSGLDARHAGFAQIGLGSTAWLRKQSRNARRLWAGAGKTPDVALARAAAEAGAGAADAQTSLRAADDATRARDLSPRARRYLIEIYLAAGAPEKALAVVRAADLAEASHEETFRAAKGTAKSIRFYDFPLLTGLARMYRELARIRFEQAAGDARIKPTADYYLGEVLAAAGQDAEAQKYIQAFLDLPQAPAQYRERARVRQALLAYRRGRHAESESVWSEISAKNRDPEVLADIVQACTQTGAKCTKAMAQLAAAAESGDGRRFQRLNFALGNYYLRKKDYVRAVGYFEAGRDKSNKNKIAANDPAMLTGLAEAYYRTKKFSEGLEIFFEMHKEFPVVRQIQEAMQGMYSMEQRSAGDVKIF